MAGNANSGSSIPFRMSETELKKNIEKFRNEFGDGSRGMVTWPRFCAFLGYSVEEVRECYVRGFSSENAYSERAKMLLRFRTECRAMTQDTSDGRLTLARDEIAADYLTPPGQKEAPPPVQILFGNGDGRFIEAMK